MPRVAAAVQGGADGEVGTVLETGKHTAVFDFRGLGATDIGTSKKAYRGILTVEVHQRVFQ